MGQLEPDDSVLTNAPGGDRDKRGPGSRGATSAVLALACAAQFMVVLDVSVVNVALPSIQRALGFDPAGLQWVVNAYALVFAGFLLLGGRLADLYGRRRVFVLGLFLFTASSLVGGLANSPALLVAARAVQGLGAAVLAPATLTILTTTFAEGAARTRAVATWTAVSSAGGAAGNLIGGVLTESLSWRWILLINVPIGALALAAALPLLPGDRERGRGQRLDVPGAALATVGVGALTYGISQIESRGWSSPVTGAALAAGVLALTAFVVVEARFAPAPLIPPRLFRARAISVGNTVMLLAGACFIPMWYFLSLYMQNVLHYGALKTGLGFLPHTLVGIVGARSAPRVMEYVGARKVIVISAALSAAGFLWQSQATPDSGYLVGLLGPAVVMSAGMGLLITPITTTVTSGIGDADAGAASGLMNATRQIGGSVGLAVLVAVAAGGGQTAAALSDDYGRAFLAMAGMLVAVVAGALALPGPREERPR
ncbi:MFS transporter [Streptomyces silaceus]|uniref:MFS transporter n=1 Tax=Streptomyces silaceus TaxID=545123 RepID=UPI00099EEB2D|nr:MFS transporter [Streptomyces silaceus]